MIKRILIVGGSNGIGLSIATELAARASMEKVYVVDKAVLAEEYNHPKIEGLFLINFWKRTIAGYEIKRTTKQRGWKWTIKKHFHPNALLWNFVNLFIDHVGVSKKLLNVCASAKSYSKMGLLSFTGFNPKLIWNKEWFDEIITLPFEFTEIPCPKEYDPILRTQYGDYMKFVKGGQIHTMALCDPDTPFKEKLFR